MDKDLFRVMAESFRYPAPSRLENLQQGLAALPDGKEKQGIAGFIRRAAALSLSGWEELYTRTWDLDPPAAPYVGYQIWGEQYQRGVFMARLRQEYRAAGLPPEGELPDHVALVLAYLSLVEDPLPELIEALPKAFEKMYDGLRKADRDNPYLGLLDALRRVEWETGRVKEK